MKISEMVQNLQEFKAKHGDIECWYAEDDEGNGYQRVYFTPSLYYVNSDGTVHQEKDEYEECGENIDDIKPICIVN